LMMTQASIPVYEVFRFVQQIQFPYRFGSALTVSMAAMVALACPILFSARPRFLLALMGILLAGWIAADIWAGSAAYAAWRKMPPERALTYRKWSDLEREEIIFWPRPAEKTRLTQWPALEVFLAEHPARALELKPGGSATVQSWKPREIRIAVNIPEKGQLTLGHFYYRDWQAQASGESLPVTSSPAGLLEVRVPPGNYTLILTLVRDRAERWGTWISAISLLLVSALGIRKLLD